MIKKYIGELVYWGHFGTNDVNAIGVVLGPATEIPHDIGHPGTQNNPNYTVFWFIAPPAWCSTAAEHPDYIMNHLLKDHDPKS